MLDIAESAAVRHASASDATNTRASSGMANNSALVPIPAIEIGRWRALSARAIEPNGYYLADWELAVSASARDRTGASALVAWSDSSCPEPIGLMPVVSLWQALKIPLPALVSAHPYGTLCTPLLDTEHVDNAVGCLLRQARRVGARALVLRDVSIDGAAVKAILIALQREGLHPRLLRSYKRACLNATRNADELLHEALGGKKLKELRRQRHRLAEHGPVTFDVAKTPSAVATAIETFLRLEASGWKSRRGTALCQHAGDAAFIRRATVALAEQGQCEIATLNTGDVPIAGAIMLRHRARAFYFKIGIDERFAKFSPGVQLTLELTRHLCEDSEITSADSTASADHPLINSIWRDRIAVGDILIPLNPRDPVVTLIHGTLIVYNSVRETVCGALRLLRSVRRRAMKKRPSPPSAR